MSDIRVPAALAAVRARWRAVAPREQALMTTAAWILGFALVWWLLMAPPLRVLGQAEAQRLSLEAQIQKMQTLQAQAQALQSQPKLGREDAVRALEASVRQRLGTAAQLSVAGDRVTLTLRNVPADALAQWLTQARVNARATPLEARLARVNSVAAPAPASATGSVGSGVGGSGGQGVPRSPVGPGVAPGAPAPLPSSGTVAWDGTLVMSLPAQ